MIRDYTFGWHEARSTFGNAKAGERLSEVVRHLADQTRKTSLCGVTADIYAKYSWLAIAQRIDGAKICELCETAGKLEEATLNVN